MILAGSSNYEDGLTNGGWLRIYDLERKSVGKVFSGKRLAAGLSLWQTRMETEFWTCLPAAE